MTTYFYIHKSIQFNLSEKGEKETGKLLICFLIRVAIMRHIKDEKTIQVKREVKIKIRIQEIEYSDETSRVWLFSELCSIHHKHSHTV